MRSIVYYLGMGIILLALGMIINAGISMHDLHKAQLLSFELLEPGFWINNPNNYLSGLTPNGRWASLIFGGFMLFFVGKYIVNLTYGMD
jgi:hypothetical protein